MEVELKSGHQKFKLVKKRYEMQELRLNISRGRKINKFFPMDFQYGEMRIKSEPSNVRVYINGT